MKSSCLRMTGFIFIFLASFFLQKGLTLQIDITPNEFKEIGRTTVNMSCYLSPNEQATIKDIVIMEIFQNDVKALAILRKNSEVFNKLDESNDFLVTGHINDFNSYLTIHLLKPSIEYVAKYTCAMYYINESGLLKEEKVSANLTMQKTEELMESLLFRVSKLENRFKKLPRENSEILNDVKRTLMQYTKNRTKEITDDIKYKTSSVTDILATLQYNISNIFEAIEEDDRNDEVNTIKIKSLEKQIQSLTQKQNSSISKLENQITSLLNRVDNLINENVYLNHTVTHLINVNQIQLEQDKSMDTGSTNTSAFSAGYDYDAGFQLTNRETIVFKNIFLNLMNGYSNTTGVFTAPRDGIYLFHLTLGVIEKKVQVFKADMMKNNNTILASIIVPSDENLNGPKLFKSSVSSITVLKTGDKVQNIIGEYGPFSSVPINQGIGHHLNVFSGILIKEL